MRIPGFLVEFITPIVKTWKGKKELTFYTLPQYETWKAENNDGKGWQYKYYKVRVAADAHRTTLTCRVWERVPLQTPRNTSPPWSGTDSALKR
jgi:hypothetical protein